MAGPQPGPQPVLRGGWRRRLLGPVGLSLGLHALGLAAGLYLWTEAAPKAHEPKPALQVSALVECIEPGYEDEIADCLEQYPLDVVSDLVPDLEDLSFPDDSLVDSSAEDTSTPEDRDLPPALNELQATSSPEAAPKSAPGAFFEVPLDAIRVRIQAEPTLAEPTERVAPTPTPTPTPKRTSQPVSTSRRAPGVALRVLSQPNVLSYYPLEARRRGIEGRALVLLDVDTRGHVTRARILQSTGSPLLDRQAVRYTRAMRFHSGSGGQLRAPVHFSLR